MTRKRVVQRRRFTGRRKADKRQRIGSNPAGTESAVYTDVIAQTQTAEQCDELINHLEGEMKKTKSPALKRRLAVAIVDTRQRQQQLQTASPVKKTRPVKPKQLFMGLDRKITDNRPLATPPREREDEMDDENSYE